MIIVEGADNTGKTGLVSHLVEEFHVKRVPRYHILPPQDYEEWAKWLLSVMNRSDVSTLIADRFFISEFVYGPIKRGKIGISFEDQLKLTDVFRGIRPIIILCDPGEDAIRKTFAEREQYPSLTENLQITHAFRNLLKLPPFNYCPQYVYDYTVDPYYENIDRCLRAWGIGGDLREMW